MKKYLWLLILLLPIRLLGQSVNEKYIAEKWKEVEALLAIKNYEQTLPYIAVIKAHAKKENNSAEWIRAILAENQIKTINQTGEQAFISIRKHFERTISEANIIEKAILNNYYAMFLWSKANSYMTKSLDSYLVADGTKKRQLIDSIFRESLKNEQILTKQSSEKFIGLFSEVKNLTLTPTIYHFLSYQYLDFLKQINKTEEYNALYQSILALNKKNKFADATSYLLTKDIETYHYRNQEWIPKIEQIINTYPSDYNAYLLYLVANSYYDSKKSKVFQYIQIAKSNYAKSPWIENIIRLEKRLKQAELNIEQQLFEPSNAYVPIKLTTRNVNKLFLRVYKTTNTPKEYKVWNVKYDSLTYLTSLEAELLYEESKDLKSFDDFENHSTIYKLNPLPYGNYTILASNNAAFKNDGEEKTTVVSKLVVSDVFITATLDEETDNNEAYKVLLINRKTGAPYANKQVHLYKTQKNTPELIAKLKTDSKGEFIYKSNTRQKYTDLDDLELYLPQENQLIDLTELDDVPEHLEKEEESNGYTQFQTMSDRAIYRPGQEIYFKSILYNNHKIKGHVLTNKDIKVYLLDANYQKIDSLTLTTNEFGSINGKFKIPAQTLAGTFRLELKTPQNEIGSHYFRVEEYKRPTFKVEFEPNKETYTHADTAVFVGKVESLAGAKLSDASVRYKVNFYNSKNYKTVNYIDSLIQTNDEGKFYIKIPLADTTFTQLKDFRLNYSAEVTNQSGEMQQASDGYNFTTKPWRIAIHTNPNVEEGKFSKIIINTTNQHGHPLKFAGKINIYKSKLHKKPISNYYGQYFKDVSYHLLQDQEYEKYFPNYFDELTIKKQKKSLVASYEFNTNDTALIKIDSTLFKKGLYEIEALSIQGQDTIKNFSDVRVYDAQTKKINNADFFSYSLDKNSYSIGDKVNITFSTDVANPTSLFLFESLGNKKLPTKVLSWKKGKITYSFTLTEKTISPTILLNALFVNNNQAQNFTIHIPIVEKSKRIVITTHTFRDKITPGQKEKWKFTLKAKDSKLTAELLATMYDSSLDDFRSNSFPAQFSLYQDYSSINFYYLLQEFNQLNSSYANFRIYLNEPELDNSLSIPYTYNLWIPQDNHYLRRNFGNDSGMLEEVVVVGYEPRTKQSLTGSARGYTRGVEGGTGVGEEIFQSVALYDELKAPDLRPEIKALKNKAKQDMLNYVQVRTNLQETVFFYPTLYTDVLGNVSFEFDSPEALTKWKLLLFAHSKTLESGSATFFTQTQKQLMVRPNLPRYLREGDKITLKAQIQNLSKEIQKGNARIEIINPESNENITARFIAQNSTKSFEAEASKNTIVEWEVVVPKDYPSVHIKIVAATDEFSDGEMQELPILPNRILISDTEKIILKPNQTQDYKIESAHKDNLQARIQVQSNPILEIISALDYLKNYPYECNEQTVSKWFGLKMVEYIGKNYPAISSYFKSINTEEASSKLAENASLSQFKMEEMPWLRDIQQDEAKLKAIAKLFNSGIQQELKSLEQKISKNQMPSGGYAWFDGGKEKTYISTRILEVMGKALLLDHTLVNANMKTVAQKLVKYLDNDTTIFNPKYTYHNALDYLYARQYWNGFHPLDKNKVEKLQATIRKSSLTTANQPAGLAAKSWVSSQIFGTAKTSNEIKNRITQEAISDTEKGMYWESNSSYYNNTSLQSYMVEAYKLHDPSKLHNITQWLFYSKQANHWGTTWMTVDAVYALLLANNPKDFVVENTVKVWIDEEEAEQNKLVLGQFTKNLSPQELKSNKFVKVQNNNSRTIFGNIVHQYFSPLESIQKTIKDISIKKQYLVERDGKWIETSEAKLGERIKVKITIVNDNPLQYVHIKDARPSGVEPIYQPSGYKWWQGYYFTIKDASTNYFYDNLKKGLTELEYEVKANNVGIFNSGITTVECMYDPSVTARSENKILMIIP
ncbi:alpha-2-macroglobulin family protein [Sphingobacterium bovistauri]|uniref:Alpha-2-macroglobulin n=1 Tax=Sphingobacterium bovistauri TaxID=2781959 RepID=A0ABS7Z5Y6_9SPHI|nr:MG2 domain-containing protein [Sphingobacterium bovistauri]MCA5005570.1 alpha-2-macroglobulin [Sphingobacterium bovistauri]